MTESKNYFYNIYQEGISSIFTRLINYPPKDLINRELKCILKIDRNEKTFKLEYPNGLNYNLDELTTPWEDRPRFMDDPYTPEMHRNCDIVCNCKASVQNINLLNLYNIKNTIVCDINKIKELGFTDTQYETELNKIMNS